MGRGFPGKIWGGLISATPNLFLADTSFFCLVAIFLYSRTEGEKYKSESKKMGVAEMNRVAEIRNLEWDSLFLEIWSVPVIYPLQIIATSTALVVNFYFTRCFYHKAQCSTRNFSLTGSSNVVTSLSEYFN